jgi:hypothetical protein
MRCSMQITDTHRAGDHSEGERFKVSKRWLLQCTLSVVFFAPDFERARRAGPSSSRGERNALIGHTKRGLDENLEGFWLDLEWVK